LFLKGYFFKYFISEPLLKSLLHLEKIENIRLTLH
jgi:hypothetical protein